MTLNLPDLDPSLQNGSSADYVNSDSGKTARVYSWVLICNANCQAISCWMWLMWGKGESTWRQDWKPSIKYRAVTCPWEPC